MLKIWVDRAAGCLYCAFVPADPPPLIVLWAFGVDAAPRLLPGGSGSSWVAGEVVLKPQGGPVDEWMAGALNDVVLDGVRLAPPVSTRDGAWLCEGCSATRLIEGGEPDRSAASTWIEIVEAGRAFHRAVAHLPRPNCLDYRMDWWALADRAGVGRALHPVPSRVRRSGAAAAGCSGAPRQSPDHPRGSDWQCSVRARAGPRHH